MESSKLGDFPLGLGGGGICCFPPDLADWSVDHAPGVECPVLA